MSKKIIKTDKASLPVGPYNQAVSIGNLIYTAGQIPLDKQGNMVAGGIKEQTEQVIQNLIAVLTHGGSSLDKDGCARLSEAAFQKIWDNPLDADYDRV